MNRKQFSMLAGKYRKLAIQLEQDAKRVRVSGHPSSEYADRIRAVSSEVESIARTIETEST